MLSTLPLRLTLEQMQLRWASLLNPLLRSPAATPVILQNVELVVGDNVVSHKLDRPLRAWRIIRMRTNFAEVYDTQDSNPNPSMTLFLNASAAVSVDLEVY